MPNQTIWPLELHTEAKHVILRKYLDAWIPILTKYNGRVIICDGFAGPGVYSNGEDGSPVIALKALSEHAHRAAIKAQVVYIFIESDKKRYESLQNVIAKLEISKSAGVHTINEEYEVAFGEILDYLDEEDSRIAPTFAFIDPFGIKGVSLEIIKRLMAHRRCEVFITFMLSALQRFVTEPEFEEPSDRLFGTNEWRIARELAGADRENFLRTLYQDQLRHEVGAEYVRFFTMKDAKNRTIYDLFFATHHEKGIDAMKAAMWRVDKTGAYSFFDATDPDQETLFTDQPDWDQLFDVLAERFSGLTMPWPDVEEAIRQTAFQIRKRPIQVESKKDEARFVIINPPGKRQGTLDAQSQIEFLE